MTGTATLGRPAAVEDLAAARDIAASDIAASDIAARDVLPALRPAS